MPNRLGSYNCTPRYRSKGPLSTPKPFTPLVPVPAPPLAFLILGAALPNLGFANDRTETQQRAVLWIIEALAHIDNREGWYMHPERPIETIDHDTVERRYSKKWSSKKSTQRKK